MYKKDYYYIVAGLPELEMGGERKGLTSLQFRKEMAGKIKGSDFKFLNVVYLQHDNKNLLSILLNRSEKFDALGIYSQEYINAQIENPNTIIDYIRKFILDFNSGEFDESPVKAETQLWASYFNYVLKSKNDFVTQWFLFERDVRNLLAAINCRTFDYDLEEHLIPDDNGLCNSLITTTPSVKLFEDQESSCLEQIFQVADSSIDMNTKEMKIDQLKWSYLDEITFFYYFSIEKILSFAIKLEMVDRWRKLDHTSGKALWERLVYDLEMSYYFADEFSLNQKK